MGDEFTVGSVVFGPITRESMADLMATTKKFGSLRVVVPGDAKLTDEIERLRAERDMDLVTEIERKHDEITRLRDALAEKLWTCPECNFSFSREHDNVDGSGYSCPLCGEHRLGEQLASLKAELAAAREQQDLAWRKFDELASKGSVFDLRDAEIEALRTRLKEAEGLLESARSTLNIESLSRPSPEWNRELAARIRAFLDAGKGDSNAVDTYAILRRAMEVEREREK